MNPLQEHAHLFANGKFRVKYSQTVSNVRQKGCINILDPVELDFLMLHKLKRKSATLIARPISDMTDAERKRWKQECKKYNDHGMLYALSIGCLPMIFDKCFDDGTVIEAAEAHR